MKSAITTILLQLLYKIVGRFFDSGDATTGDLNFENRELTVYVHFPFCDAVCRYCPFSRTVAWSGMTEYLDSVVTELEVLEEKGLLEGATLTSLAFGGGTPSLIPEDRLRAITEKLERVFPSYDSVQKTIECTPRSITRERLRAFADLGFNRLSVGVQSFRQEVLEELGRQGSRAEIIESLNLVAMYWRGTWSADMIYGFDSHNTDEFLEDLETLVEAGVDHLSLFPLVNCDSKNRQHLDPSQLSKMEEMHRLATTLLESRGFDAYSVEDFSRSPESECQYQKDSWGFPQRDLLVLGSGAFGISGDVRYRKVKDRKAYQKQVARGVFPLDRHIPINQDRALIVRSLMGLHYNSTPPQDLLLYRFLERAGILLQNQEEIYLTEHGRFITSLLWAKIMLDRMTA